MPHLPVRPFLARCLPFLCACHLAAFAAPSVPEGLDAGDHDDGVRLSWQPSTSSGSVSYFIQRLTRDDVLSTTDAWQGMGFTSDTSWTQAGLAIDQSYEYRVTALDATGASLPSAPVVFARQRFGFVLPWNDISPSSAFDFRPAHDAHTRLTVAKGRLMRGAEPIRLVGVNMSAGACFPTSGEAASVAKRMAQFGINFVRFHQIDQLRPAGVFADSALTALDSAQMERLANFIRELADNGIYTDLNLHVSRAYTRVDPGPPGGDARLKGIDIFSRTTGGSAHNLRQQQKNYASLLLNWNTAAVGRLRAYPAVSIIEINNESSLLDEWTDGDLDTLATDYPSYHAELRSHWTEWLRLKYGDDATLRAKWSAAVAPTKPFGTVILDGANPPPLGAIQSPWQLQAITSAGAEAVGAWIAGDAPEASSPGNARTIKITVTKAVADSSKNYHVQLLHNGLAPDRSVAHTLRFHGKVGAGQPRREFRAAFRTGWGTVTYGSATLVLTEEWQEFTVCFPPLDDYAGADDPAATSHSFSLTNFAAQTGDIYLSGLSLVTGNAIAGPVATRPEHATVQPGNHLHSGTNSAAFNFTDLAASGWILPAAASPEIVENGRSPGVSSLKFSVPAQSGASPGDLLVIRAFYDDRALDFGETYELRFDARASPEAAGRPFTANGQLNAQPWTSFGSATFTATTEWKTYAVCIHVLDDSARRNRIAFGLGAIAGDLEIANLYLRKGGQVGLPEGQSVAAGAFVEPLTRNELYGRFRAAQTDWLAFLWDTELKYWIEMRDHVRTTVGTSALLLGTQGEMCPNLLQEAAGFDIIDAHGYWQHPTSFSPGWTALNTSMTGAPDLRRTTIPIRAGKRILGKPYLVSEYAHPAPNTYGTEGFPVLGAYAALQGWSGFAAFEYEHVLRKSDNRITWDSGYEGWLTAGRAPAKMVTFPAAASMLGRGDVATAYSGELGGLGGAASVTISDATAIEIIRQTRRSDLNVTDFGLDALLAYRVPVGMKRSPTTRPADARVLPVDTRPSADLVWNSADGHLLVKTRRTKAAIGQLPPTGAVDLGEGVTITTPPTKLHGTSWMEGATRVEHPVKNWAGFILTRTDSAEDLFFGDPGTRWLLTTTGYADNHFIRWRENLGPFDDKSAVGDFGRTPSLVERITGSMTFAVPSGTLIAHALDPNGEPASALRVDYSEDSGVRIATVSLPEQPETIWYAMEVVPAPPPSPFDQWRAHHFTSPDLASAAPDADPDGDGLSNLLEYALARSPLAADAGPMWSLTRRPVAGRDHLAISYRRRSDDPALSCLPETSGDLLAWAEDAVLLPEVVSHEDGTETVTYRDAVPLDLAPRRFLRLRVALRP